MMLHIWTSKLYGGKSWIMKAKESCIFNSISIADEYVEKRTIESTQHMPLKKLEGKTSQDLNCAAYVEKKSFSSQKSSCHIWACIWDDCCLLHSSQPSYIFNIGVIRLHTIRAWCKQQFEHYNFITLSLSISSSNGMQRFFLV